MQSLKKNWLVVSNITLGISWIFTQSLKGLKSSLWWALLPKVKVWAKNYRGVIFHDTEQWCRIWINFGLVVSKMAWGIGWTFIKALKSHYGPICFSYKISEELCIMTLKEDAKFKGKLTPGLKKDKRNLVNFRARSGKSENSHFDGILLPKA